MKRIIKAEALTHVSSFDGRPRKDFSLQAEATEDNQDRTEGKDVGNSERKTEDDAQHAGPVHFVSSIPACRACF